MPRLVNCIKNCCYSLLLAALMSAISSLFVWQAEVYQSTIDDQIRAMKLDMSAMKKENHLMEIKLNEQYGKHDDLKEEFRYLVKQAKWSVSGDQEGEVDTAHRPDLVKKEARADNDLLQDALNNLAEEDEEELDLSKRTHMLIVSEQYGGGEVLAGLLSHDPNIFFLPSVGGVVKTARHFQEVAHCTITPELVEHYKSHLPAALLSKSLSKFCPGGSCSEGNFTAENLERECRSKHVTVMGGTSEDWPLSVLESLTVEVAYISRDPRAVVSGLLEAGLITAEEVQSFSSQHCSRVHQFLQHSSSSHHLYQVFSYEKIAASPISSLSLLYHQLLDTTHTPPLALSKQYRNQLYLSISQWKSSLPQIAVDAVEEECGAVLGL